MAVAWTDEETFKLIELWGNQSVQEKLEGCKKNSQVYSKISEEMCEAGYERSLVQCQDKINKLRGDYRKIKDAHKQTGNKRKRSKFFDKMNEVLPDKHSVTLPVVLDTSATTSSTVELSTSTDGLKEISAQTNNEELLVRLLEKRKKARIMKRLQLPRRKAM